VKEAAHKDPYEENRKGPLAQVVRLFFLLALVVLCLFAAFLLYARWLGSAQTAAPWAGGAPDLNPARRLYLQTYLVTNAGALAQPVGDGVEAVEFVIEPGQSAATIAGNLAQAGLLDDATLLLNYLRYHGLDAQLEAGAYQIDPRWTVPDLAVALTESLGQEVTLRFLEGWRVEEMAAYLSTVGAAQIDGNAFLEIVLGGDSFDLTSYPIVAREIPPGASLEGFLFPDTYRLPLDAEAADVVDMMLRNFEQRVTPELRAGIVQNGLSLYQGVTLASIVEREAPLAAERPRVATVFYNRLDDQMRLQADPTVQYAVGFDPATESWWKSQLTRADLQLPSPYNTYVHDGLPPGPIANPGLSSLEAVAYPMPSNELFFVADCERESAHLFSETYEQHVANVQRCRQE
jgi:UPF0755 protein